MSTLTVLGIGNVLMRDEGIGVHLLEAVRQGRHWPENVEFVDGGAGGLNLLNVVEEASRMVVFDAAEMHLKPGEHRLIHMGQVSSDDLTHRVSMHEVPLTETLCLCAQFTHRPDDIRLLVVQPGSIDFGRELTDEVAAVFPALVEAGTNLVLEMCPTT